MTLFIVIESTHRLRSVSLNSKDEFKLTAVNFDTFLLNNSMMNKLIVINLNSSQTSETRQFSHIKIFINKADNSAEDILIEEVKTFLYIKVSKRKQNNDDDKQDLNELLFKISQAMLTLIAFTADERNFNNVKTDIFTFVIYAEAVKDSI